MPLLYLLDTWAVSPTVVVVRFTERTASPMPARKSDYQNSAYQLPEADV
jgi:hypothetical protein